MGMSVKVALFARDSSAPIYLIVEIVLMHTRGIHNTDFI